MGIAYNLVRLGMEQAAADALRAAHQLELRVIKIGLLRFVFGSPGKLPQRMEALREELAQYVLARHWNRLDPRAVKVKMSNYPRKRRPAKRERRPE